MMPPPHFRQLTLKPVLLLLLLFFDRALSQSVIENLPGFPGKLPFKLETGYVGVGESEEVQLFYYFIESEGNPDYDPLILWLTGGPGCTGLSPFFYEIGPLTFDFANSNGSIPTLVLNPYSWTKVASIIFIDQPAGSGFSYAKTPEAWKTNDTLAGALTYEFLRKWLINHPKYLENPLYIGGESYSGITVPIVVNEIYNGIEVGSKPVLNMKVSTTGPGILGYILGNPFTDAYADTNGRILYAFRMGLLSANLYQSAKQNCNGYYIYVDPQNNLCKDDLKRIKQCLGKIFLYHILEPWCGSTQQDMLSWHMPLNEEIPRRFLQSVPFHAESWCRDDNFRLVNNWANHKSVRKALHVREGTITEWVRCNNTLFGCNQSASYTCNVNNTVNYHKKFSHKNCRALIYSGDHDMAVPHTRTEEWINSLKLQVQNDWRPWFVEDQIAGYKTVYFHDDYELVYTTVKGAGHTPPEYEPQECFSMVERWLSGNPL